MRILDKIKLTCLTLLLVPTLSFAQGGDGNPLHRRAGFTIPDSVLASDVDEVMDLFETNFNKWGMIRVEINVANASSLSLNDYNSVLADDLSYITGTIIPTIRAHSDDIAIVVSLTTPFCDLNDNHVHDIFLDNACKQGYLASLTTIAQAIDGFVTNSGTSTDDPKLIFEVLNEAALPVEQADTWVNMISEVNTAVRAGSTNVVTCYPPRYGNTKFLSEIKDAVVAVQGALCPHWYPASFFQQQGAIHSTTGVTWGKAEDQKTLKKAWRKIAKVIKEYPDMRIVVTEYAVSNFAPNKSAKKFLKATHKFFKKKKNVSSTFFGALGADVWKLHQDDGNGGFELRTPQGSEVKKHLDKITNKNGSGN